MADRDEPIDIDGPSEVYPDISAREARFLGALERRGWVGEVKSALAVGYKHAEAKDARAWLTPGDALFRPALHREALRRVEDERVRQDLTAGELVATLAAAVRFDPADMVDQDGKLIPNLRDLPFRLRRALKGIKFAADGSVTITAHDKVQAATKLAEMMGWADLPASTRPGETQPGTRPDGLTEEALDRVPAELLRQFREVADAVARAAAGEPAIPAGPPGAGTKGLH